METWKPIPGFENYQVSDVGRIRGHKGFKSFQINEHGYLTVQVSKNGRAFSRTVHSLVALAFIGPRPRRKIVNHKNGVKTDPSRDNLEYLTHRQNSQHAVATGLTVALRGSAKSMSILHESDIVHIFADAAAGMQRRHLAAKYKVARSSIDSVLLRESWKHILVPADLIKKVQVVRKHRNVGTDNPLAKLNPEKVLQIFKLRVTGVPLDAIALTMNTSRSAVSQVLHRYIWAHVSIPKNLRPKKLPSRRLAWKKQPAQPSN